METTARKVFMVRPDSFSFNEQTSSTNTFQQKDNLVSKEFIAEMALQEFKACTRILEQNNIEVLVYTHNNSESLPDAVFPNNWFCHLPDKRLVLFPMQSPSRRKERIPEFGAWLSSQGVIVSETIDLTFLEDENAFLEGTGSLIFDHQKHCGWAALSARTSPKAIEHFCMATGYAITSYKTIPFQGANVYHTNVIQAISPKLMILAKELVEDGFHLPLFNSIADSEREILIISAHQMQHFCGNILFACNQSGTPFWIMSETAMLAFNTEQIKKLRQHAELLVFPVNFIEKTGGGSARCMLAEIF
jgi:hypothetical protein